jgi:hypothetical protein
MWWKKMAKAHRLALRREVAGYETPLRGWGVYFGHPRASPREKQQHT